jgi:hypothetical protein
VTFAEIDFEFIGILQTPPTVKSRTEVPARAGPPRGPIAPRVSITRHGCRV